MKVGPSNTFTPKINLNIAINKPDSWPTSPDSFTKARIEPLNEMNGVVYIGHEPDHEKPWWSAALYEQMGPGQEIEACKSNDQDQYLEICQMLKQHAENDDHLKSSIF